MNSLIHLPRTRLDVRAESRGPRRQTIPGRLALTRARGTDGQYELMIYGDIGESWWGESVTAADVAAQIRESGASSILVRINSYGGSVTDGTAIYNALRASGAAITTRIDGIAASIASLIAMAGDTVQMSSNTLLMSHAPWTGVVGNASELRDAADVLDTFAQAMASSYARKTGRDLADELALLTDGEDHWFTATAAREAGYADEILDEVEELDETAAAAREEIVMAALNRYRSAPLAVAANYTRRMSLLLERPTAAPAAPHRPRSSGRRSQPAARRATMWRSLARAMGIDIADDADDAAIREAIARHLSINASISDDELTAAAVRAGRGPQPPPADPAAGNRNQPPTRAQQIDQIFAVARRGRENDDNLRAIHDRAQIDEDMPIANVRAEVLAAIATPSAPIAGRHAVVQGGEDERDLRITAASNWLLVRSGVAPRDSEARRTLGENPFRGFSYQDIARAVLEDNGVNTRRMGRIDVIDAAIRAAMSQTTSDFPNIFETTLHRTVETGAASVQPTWRRFCRVGSLSDLRPHIRYRRGSIGNLQAADEHGEFKSGKLADAARESIQGASKGLIISITREMLINDDMSVFTDIALQLGQASERTIEMDVYSLFVAADGTITNGPTMGDGNALFSAAHGNIAATAGDPTVTSVYAAGTLMSEQRDPSGNDYLDIRPAIFLGRRDTAGLARVVNDSTKDPDATNKLDRKNIAAGTYGDIIDSPRAPTDAWLSLADPQIEPVFEVAFLDGEDRTQLAMDEDFSTAGMSWRAIRDYAVGAVGYRGIVRTNRS